MFKYNQLPLTTSLATRTSPITKTASPMAKTPETSQCKIK